MSHNRSFSVLFAVGSVALLALPIGLTSYVGSQRASVEFPSFHATPSSVEGLTTPISERKAEAVRQFKTIQV